MKELVVILNTIVAFRLHAGAIALTRHNYQLNWHQDRIFRIAINNTYEMLYANPQKPMQEMQDNPHPA